MQLSDLGVPESARELLDDVLAKARIIFGEEFVGMYGYGSLAMGDFDPASSDLDIIVAVAREVREETGQELQRLYAEMLRSNHPWMRRLEAAFVPVALLRSHLTATPMRHVIMNTGISTFGVGTDVLEWDWILNRHSAWRGNVVFAGPSPRTLIDPISPDVIRKTVRDELVHSWSRHLHGPEWMKPRKYQAFVVLTMCRALYALEGGELISKPRAAAWALHTLDPTWKPLIQWAMHYRHDSEAGDLTETLSFLRFAVTRGGPSTA